MPIYLVKDKETQKERLVDAPRAASALRHVTTPRFTVEPAEGLDMYRLGKDGVTIERTDGSLDEPETETEREELQDGPQPQAAQEIELGGRTVFPVGDEDDD